MLLKLPTSILLFSDALLQCACPNPTPAPFSGPGGFDVPLRELDALNQPEVRRGVLVEGPFLAHDALSVHRSCGCWDSTPSEERPW